MLMIDTTELNLVMARKQLTIRAAAKKAKLTPNTFYTVMKKGTVTPVTLGKIADALEVDPAEIVAK